MVDQQPTLLRLTFSFFVLELVAYGSETSSRAGEVARLPTGRCSSEKHTNPFFLSHQLVC